MSIRETDQNPDCFDRSTVWLSPAADTSTLVLHVLHEKFERGQFDNESSATLVFDAL
jgi:hypothetical protein